MSTLAKLLYNVHMQSCQKDETLLFQQPPSITNRKSVSMQEEVDSEQNVM